MASSAQRTQQTALALQRQTEGALDAGTVAALEAWYVAAVQEGWDELPAGVWRATQQRGKPGASTAAAADASDEDDDALPPATADGADSS